MMIKLGDVQLGGQAASLDRMGQHHVEALLPQGIRQRVRLISIVVDDQDSPSRGHFPFRGFNF